MKPDKALEIKKKSRNIYGWFFSEAAMLFAWINEIQQLNGITGDVFEIGCHHGKSTVILGAMINPQKEKLCVCDLFSDQGPNISGSGCGDLEIFNRNLEPTLEAGLELRIFQKNSNTLSVEEIGKNYRFFHIDGGHNCDEALSDLRLAADSIIEKGVIALDDPFKPEWPGVTEAVIRFLDEFSEFHAIIVGFNKMILVKNRYSNLYLGEIQDVEKRKAYGLGYPWHPKQLTFHGSPLQIFYIPPYLTKKSLKSFAKTYYLNHKWLRSPLFYPFVAVVKTILRKK